MDCVIYVVLPMERSPVWSANKYIAVAGVFDVSKLLANLNEPILVVIDVFPISMVDV